MTGELTHTDEIDFETLYLRLRQKEGRMYSNEELMRLPTISKEHPHYREWLTRRQSSKKLVRYLERKKQKLNILEVGCGNGWLSHSLAKIPGTKVIGIDVNFTELEQAARVFQHIPNLHFIYTDIRNGTFKEKEFDIVVFAASIQYFESLDNIVADSKKILKPGGEIHIIDSPFYDPSEITTARQRSRIYYEQAGFPAMANCYFHHSLPGLSPCSYEILFDPKKISNRIRRPRNPLYWIRIKND